MVLLMIMDSWLNAESSFSNEPLIANYTMEAALICSCDVFVLTLEVCACFSPLERECRGGGFGEGEV